ncbi:MAG: transcriptional repressor [Aeromonadales bacterium]|nr:transcriptional repressor [Aeromonadales bacterium]
MLKRRNTRQRDQIREYLKDRTDHPTAEKLYNELKVKNPKISLGTVYRNLMLLADEGEIQALNVGDAKTHFDPNPEPHVHFFCRKCKCVLDVHLENYDEFNQLLSRKVTGEITRCTVNLEGLCETCLKENVINLKR